MSGPGTELKAIFARCGVTPKDIASDEKGCGCTRMAAQMDAWGPDGCEANIDHIVETIAAKATKRGYTRPLMEFIVRRCVKRAIKRSRNPVHPVPGMITAPGHPAL